MFGVMIGIGVLTYLVVFNLNNLTRAVYRQYEAAKLPWTIKMFKSGGVWKDRGMRYNGFKIKRLGTTPSEWLLIWYIISWPVRLFLGPKNVYTTDKQSILQHSEEKNNKLKGTDNPNNGGWLNDHPPLPPWEHGQWLIYAIASSFVATQLTIL
jgi:amino acid transporter